MSAPKFAGLAWCAIVRNGEGVALRLECDDGSIRSVWWSVEELMRMSGEIVPPSNAPRNMALQ